MTTTPHKALLEHRTFLLRLARSLVRDESTAQDLVQDASAAYLANPPREAAASKAWLAQVVRRAAGKLHRSGARLRERESAVARPESLPSGIEALDRQLDTQLVLIELVKELPDPQREAVQLRYNGDMTPTVIAKQLGVSVSTVNTRLQRALASLRTSMDRRSGGDRDVWVSALLGVVPGAGAVAAASVPSVSAGWAPWVLGAVASTAALAALYVGLASPSDPAPSPVTIETSVAEARFDPVTSVSASTASRASAATDAMASTVTAATSQSQQGNWLVPVTISGEGVSTKQTRLFVKGVMGNYNWDSELEVSMEAPGTGAIDLHELVTRWQYQMSRPVTGIVVRVEHPDCPSQTGTFAIPPIVDKETAPAEPTEVAIELPLSCVVEGQVTLADDAAAAPTRIFAFPIAEGAETPIPMEVAHIGEAVVDAQGNYRLRMTHDGPVAMVFIARDQRPETRIVALDRGEVRTLPDVVLAGGPALEGELTWASETVPSGTRIWVNAARGSWSIPSDSFLTPFRLCWENHRFEVASVHVETNDAGRFRVSGLGNRPMDLRLNDLRPFASFSSMSLAESVAAPADLSLKLDAALLDLRFDFGDEAPVGGELEGFVVTEDDGGATVHQWIHVDEPVRVAAPRGVNVELTARFDGFAAATILVQIPETGTNPFDVAFQVRRVPPQQTSRLSLRLTVDGDPLADGTPVQLELMPSGSTNWDDLVCLEANVTGGLASFKSDLSGSFRAAAYPGRTQQWRSTKRVDASFEVELEPQRTIEIAEALAPGGRALFTARTNTGRLVDMQWRARVLDASGTALPSHFRTMKPGVNASYGGWTAHGNAELLANLPIGTYTLELRHPDFAPVDQAFTIESDSVTRVDVALVADGE